MVYNQKLQRRVGTAIILTTIVFAVWVAGWIMFIGGITQIVDAIQATPASGVDVGIGLLKVFGASTVGVLLTFGGVMTGWSIYTGLTVLPGFSRR